MPLVAGGESLLLRYDLSKYISGSDWRRFRRPDFVDRSRNNYTCNESVAISSCGNPDVPGSESDECHTEAYPNRYKGHTRRHEEKLSHLKCLRC